MMSLDELREKKDEIDWSKIDYDLINTVDSFREFKYYLENEYRLKKISNECKVTQKIEDVCDLTAPISNEKVNECKVTQSARHNYYYRRVMLKQLALSSNLDEIKVARPGIQAVLDTNQNLVRGFIRPLYQRYMY